MFKYFGTDGIRGKANVKLTPELAYKVGRYLGYKLSNKKGDKFLIGRDTRLSGQMLESALASGLSASGCDVYQVGVVVTPLVSYLLEHNDYVGGIMISASHNPYEDNGLKIMNHDGLKIDPFLQSEIEDYIDGKVSIPYKTKENIGEVFHTPELAEEYLDFLANTFSKDLSQFKIAVDAANGSTSDLVKIFDRLNIKNVVIHQEPNGININKDCGSTHPTTLQDFMKDKDYDLGVSYDGDGDRLIMFDENAEVIDGDGIMFIIANYYKKMGMLVDDTVVVTIMSNLGLLQAFDRVGIKTIITDVGDKNVFEKMETDNFMIGGEQSGHVILKHFSNMGDGLLVTLMMLTIMHDEKQTLSKLSEDLEILPQLLVNMKVASKDVVLDSDLLIDAIKQSETTLHGTGRVLVRASGTESLIRVMVEAKTDALCEHHVYSIIEVIKQIEE